MSNDTLPIDVEEVCTHEQLGNEIGGNENLLNLLAASKLGDSTVVRENALRDVLNTLRIRTPPISSSELADVTELRRAVSYKALEQLYLHAITSGGSTDRWDKLRKIYEKKYDSELLGMAPTMSGGQRGSTFGFAISRR